MQRCRLLGYHRLDREQGYKANNRDWDYVSMWVSFQPPRQCTLRMHIHWASFCNKLDQTHIRGRRPEGICLYGLARTVLLIVLTTCIEISYSESSYKKPNTSRGSVRRWHIVDTGEHHSMGISFEVFYHSCSVPVVYCSTLRSSKGGQVNSPHGVREVHAPHVWGACQAHAPPTNSLG